MDLVANRFSAGQKVLDRYEHEGAPFILTLRASPASIRRDIVPFVEDLMWRFIGGQGLGVLGMVNASRGWSPPVVPGQGTAPAFEVPDKDWLRTAGNLIARADGIVVELPEGQTTPPPELEICRTAGRSLLTLVIRPPSETQVLDEYLRTHKFVRLLDDDQVLLTDSFLLGDVVERMRSIAALRADPKTRAAAATASALPVSLNGVVSEYDHLARYYERLGAYRQVELMVQRRDHAAAVQDASS